MLNLNPAQSDFFISYPLTKISSTFRLKYVPGSDTTGHNSKQTQGGKVKYMQPPIMSGFSISATSIGDCTELSGVARNRKPSYGNTCSVTLCALRGSRLPFGCQNSKQHEKNDMQNANAPATTATAANGAKGFTNSAHHHPKPRCLIDSNVLLDAVRRAKAKHQREERGAAYHELLQEFHRLIIPAFVVEGGSISQASHLLGLHRQTMSKYIDMAGIDLSAIGAGSVCHD